MTTRIAVLGTGRMGVPLPPAERVGVRADPVEQDQGEGGRVEAWAGRGDPGGRDFWR